MKRIVLFSLAAALIIACQDQRSMTGVKPPSALLSDGSNSGNAHFFFLPPLVKQPTFSGVFNPALKPIVVICQLDVGPPPLNTPIGCSPGVAPVNPGPVTVDVTGQQYKLNWDTRQSGISDDKFYRIQVFGGAGQDVPLGFADVDPVSNGSQLRNVNTGDYIGLLDGRTLPLKFRIERGAFGTNCVRDCAEASVDNNGGTVITNTGFSGALFPPLWIRPDVIEKLGIDNVVVTIERIDVADLDGPCIPENLPQAEGCYRFKTFPNVGLFNTDVTVGICVEVPEGNVRHDGAQLFSLEEDQSQTVTPLPNAAATFVSCEGFASASSRSTLGPLARGLLYLGSWLAPSPAHAAHLGAGGLSGSFSRIGWVLPRVIDFDVRDGEAGQEPVPPGTAVNRTYADSGVSFVRIPGSGETCAVDGTVFANPTGNPFALNAVGVCASGSAAFSETNDGVIVANFFNSPASQVCIDVGPSGSGATGFIEAYTGQDAAGTLVGRTVSTPGQTQAICVASAQRNVFIGSVRFAGTASASAFFDNLQVTFSGQFSD